MYYIYVNLKKTEHLFTSIKLLEKKKLVYVPVMDVCMILVSYGITLLQMYPFPCLDILNNDSQIKKNFIIKRRMLIFICMTYFCIVNLKPFYLY